MASAKFAPSKRLKVREMRAHIERTKQRTIERAVYIARTTQGRGAARDPEQEHALLEGWMRELEMFTRLLLDELERERGCEEHEDCDGTGELARSCLADQRAKGTLLVPLTDPREPMLIDQIREALERYGPWNAMYRGPGQVREVYDLGFDQVDALAYSLRDLDIETPYRRARRQSEEQARAVAASPPPRPFDPLERYRNEFSHSTDEARRRFANAFTTVRVPREAVGVDQGPGPDSTRVILINGLGATDPPFVDSPNAPAIIGIVDGELGPVENAVEVVHVPAQVGDSGSFTIPRNDPAPVLPEDPPALSSVHVDQVHPPGGDEPRKRKRARPRRRPRTP